MKLTRVVQRWGQARIASAALPADGRCVQLRPGAEAAAGRHAGRDQAPARDGAKGMSALDKVAHIGVEVTGGVRAQAQTAGPVHRQLVTLKESLRELVIPEAL
jgi:hypothetical protein